MRYILATLLLANVVGAGLWDIIATYRGDTHDTVSTTLREWSIAWPVLPLLVGVIIGHIFWPNGVRP